MPIDREFLELMPDTVTLEPKTGQDAYDTPIYGAPVPYRARISGNRRLVSTSDGRQIVSSTTVYIFGAPSVGVDDRITLPDGSQPEIASVGDYSDERGPHHTVVYLGGV